MEADPRDMIYGTIYIKYIYSFNYHLAVPRLTLGHYGGDSLTHLMLITVFLQFQPEGHWEPRNKGGPLSTV